MKTLNLEISTFSTGDLCLRKEQKKLLFFWEKKVQFNAWKKE